MDESNEIDQELVDKQSRELVEAYMQTYYCMVQRRIEEPLTIEDLIVNVQSATEFLANMILSTAGVLQISQEGTNNTMDEIAAGLSVDALENLTGLLKYKISEGPIPIGRLVIPEALKRRDH